MVQMPGKRVRTVPVLILPQIKNAMILLVELRTKHSIHPENPFFFAITSTNATLDSCKCMRTMTRLAQLEKPDLITSTNLRKYMATVVQVID